MSLYSDQVYRSMPLIDFMCLRPNRVSMRYVVYMDRVINIKLEYTREAGVVLVHIC